MPANIVYRNDDGQLKIGVETDSEQLSQSVYRSQADKKIVKRDGVFVEVNLDGSGERVLFKA